MDIFLGVFLGIISIIFLLMSIIGIYWMRGLPYISFGMVIFIIGIFGLVIIGSFLIPSTLLKSVCTYTKGESDLRCVDTIKIDYNMMQTDVWIWYFVVVIFLLIVNIIYFLWMLYEGTKHIPCTLR